MKTGRTVIITKKGSYYNMPALLIEYKGNFVVLQVRGETHPITIHKDYIKDL